MTRYVALLRGVSPMNAKMPELKRCFEAAGFSDVKTLLSSGNVAFSVPRATSTKTLERKAEAAMQAQLGHSFGTIVRSAAHLQGLIDADHYQGHRLPAGAKRVITFLRAEPTRDLELPVARDDAAILARIGLEVYSAYVPGSKGPVFMQLIERSYGRDVTTRTVDTVRKCAAA